MSDSNVVVILYHPNCKASQKLLSMIPDNFEGIRAVNIQTIEVPHFVKSVPCGVIDGNPITGKVLFDKVNGMISGPKSIDLNRSSKQAGFINNSSNCQLNSGFSTIDEDRGMDGFSGVPKFDQAQVRSVEDLRSERN